MLSKAFFLLLFPLLLLGEAKIELGIDRFFKDGFSKEIEGKRVGLITNQTGVDKNLKTTLDLFFEHKESFVLKALFAPEHGLQGKSYAAEKIDHEIFRKTPVHSLHGATRRPTAEMLKNIDVLVFDIQDIGCRPYTYTSTLYYVMEEAAKHKIPVIVLDRPNPINGVTIDGPMLDERFRSFIGYINIPYIHGMTIGELARYFNGEYKIGTNLTVIPMKGWKRGMSFEDTGLHWIPTSPNIPEDDTPFFTATTGALGEINLVNIGIGYTLPFKIVGAPWIDGEKFAAALNSKNLPGVLFTPIHYKPFYGSFKGTDCHGVKIVITDKLTYKPITTQYVLVGALKALYPDIVKTKVSATPKANKDLFNKANGNETLFQSLIADKYTLKKLLEEQIQGRDAFLEKRKQYLLY